MAGGGKAANVYSLRHRHRHRPTAHPTAPRPGGLAPARALRRGANAETSAGVQGATTSPSRSATAEATFTPSAAARESSAAIKGVLHAARASAAGRRLRVSFAMGQVGWALSATSLTVSVMIKVGQSIDTLSIDTEAEAVYWWLVPAPLGICLLLLALFPTDARAIRVVCASLLVTWTGSGALFITSTLSQTSTWIPGQSPELPDVLGFPLAALHFAAAGGLAPALRCRGDRAMQPRSALRRLWAA